MPDAIFEHPRLAAIYDALEGDRADLDVYVGIVDQLSARRVLDIGCGTGTFALLLAKRGLDVTGVDPAVSSLAVARSKPGAGSVQWLAGDATVSPLPGFDVATMTGNVAQAIVEPEEWHAALDRFYEALRPGGHLVFETRDPAFRGWEGWTRDRSHRVVDAGSLGEVETWFELTEVALPLVGFRGTFVFRADGERLISDSMIRFRERDEVEEDLARHGFEVAEVRDAPDRPGRELVFIARRAR